VKLPVPTRGITPRDFYHQYVPALWAALVGPVPSLAGVTVGVSVSGDADYAIAVIDKGLVTTDGKPAEPLMTFSTDVASWRIALLDLLPRVLAHIEPKAAGLRAAHYLARIDLEAVRKTPGSIIHVYEDDAGDEARVALTIGNGAGPSASIQVTDTELWRLLESGAKLSQLVRSRVKVGGDIAYILALARLVEA
jgi:hypothetical protein